jgi:hypothetical protein
MKLDVVRTASGDKQKQYSGITVNTAHCWAKHVNEVNLYDKLMLANIARPMTYLQ